MIIDLSASPLANDIVPEKALHKCGSLCWYPIIIIKILLFERRCKSAKASLPPID